MPPAPPIARLRELTLSLCAAAGLDAAALLALLPAASALELLRVAGAAPLCPAAVYTRDRVLPEADVLAIPLACTSLRRLELAHLDFRRDEDGCTSYYGAAAASWLVDDLAQRFRLMHPRVALRIHINPRADEWL
nr:hypothetical protein HK105_002827 [Polyrhizophydium stewartii]